MYILQEIIGGGTLDWEKAEELLELFPEIKKSFIQEVREDLAMGDCVDPVGKVYTLIKDFSEFGDYFTIFPNYLATQVDVNKEELFEKMHKEGLIWEDLDKFTLFLLDEAGVKKEEYETFLEEQDKDV